MSNEMIPETEMEQTEDYQDENVNDDNLDEEVGDETEDFESEQSQDYETDDDEYGEDTGQQDLPAEQQTGDGQVQDAGTERLTNVESQVGQLAGMIQNLTGIIQQQQNRQPQPPQQQQRQYTPPMPNQLLDNTVDIDSMTPEQQTHYAVQKAVQHANAMAQNMLMQQRSEIAEYINRTNKAIGLILNDRPDKDIVFKAMAMSQQTGMDFDYALQVQQGLAAAEKNKHLETKANQQLKANKNRRKKAVQRGGNRPVSGPPVKVKKKNNTLYEDIAEAARELSQQGSRKRR